jgi:hypothetical protein
VADAPLTRANNRYVQAQNITAVRTVLANALERFLAGKLDEATYVRMVGRQLNRLTDIAADVRPKE